MGLHRVAPRVDAEQFGPAAGGPVDAEQAPDRGRLPCPVRAQVAVHLAGLDRQVERVERQRFTVALGQAFGLNGLHVAGGSAAFQSHAREQVAALGAK